MAGSGQFAMPVEVEVLSDLGADVADDGTPPPFLPPTGLAISGYEDATGFLRVVRVDGSGNLVVSIAGGGGIIINPNPGTVILAEADTAIAMSGTSALPVPPANTRQMTVQNTGPAGSLIRVRQVGGAAGVGFILPRFSSITFGGISGSVAALECEDIAAIATSAMVVYEIT